ncbi:hypothetical protein [Saccharopolyspora phatthalungensis]|uniref:Uncharacterized protein n=1 Tax=Saccharopolyspora phatthalungensis TaxID=664693 RepID=A0A840QCJ0_9PSEU|nr:hypothetical protein [Saccharopolyspora phatthalungensis]MBB5156338.1 hypothetical protein [Saccharopolyspora phatthalungensis]
MRSTAWGQRLFLSRDTELGENLALNIFKERQGELVEKWWKQR